MTRRTPVYQPPAPVVLSQPEADAIDTLRCAKDRGVLVWYRGPGLARRLAALGLARAVGDRAYHADHAPRGLP